MFFDTTMNLEPQGLDLGTQVNKPTKLSPPQGLGGNMRGQSSMNNMGQVQSGGYNTTGYIVKAAELASMGVDYAVAKKGKKDAGYGNTYTSAGAQAGQMALKGAAAGAQMGMMFGPYGALIGGAVGAIGGGVAGFVKGKKDEKKAVKQANKMYGQTLTAMNTMSGQQQNNSNL